MKHIHIGKYVKGTTRREFIWRSATGLALASLADCTLANTKSGDESRPIAETAPIRSLIRRDDTILRLGGDAGGFAMTWAADDNQLIYAGDGCGWPERPKHHRYYASRLFSLSGSPRAASFKELGGYPDIPIWEYAVAASSFAPYYASSALAIGNHIYQYLSTFERPIIPDADGTWTQKSSLWGATGGIPYSASKLIYSADNGVTWCNQNGSSPVVLENEHEKSPQTMAFFKEVNFVFSAPAFLQMGKAYDANRDGYVYAYSVNGCVDTQGQRQGNPEELVMFRVPKGRVLDRSAYEYFAGDQPGGVPKWSKDLNARRSVYTLPKNAGSDSIVYNAPLRVYMMGHSSSHWPEAKPSYLAFSCAPNPWGPWKLIYEESSWINAVDRKSFPVGASISPKWISADGKSFWFAWTELNAELTWDDAMFHAFTEAEFLIERRWWRKRNRYFGFNAQRVDFVFQS